MKSEFRSKNKTGQQKFMHRSNRTSTSPPPPPPGKPRAFYYLLCPGSGEFDLCLRGVGKIEPEVSGFK